MLDNDRGTLYIPVWNSFRISFDASVIQSGCWHPNFLSLGRPQPGRFGNGFKLGTTEFPRVTFTTELKLRFYTINKHMLPRFMADSAVFSAVLSKYTFAIRSTCYQWFNVKPVAQTIWNLLHKPSAAYATSKSWQARILEPFRPKFCFSGARISTRFYATALTARWTICRDLSGSLSRCSAFVAGGEMLLSESPGIA